MTDSLPDDDDGTQAQPYSTVPHNNKTYSQHAYWEERFEHESEYEWLVGFNDIRSTLLPLLRTDDRILVIGCGNSSLSAELYECGYRDITNIDFSETVIRKQAAKHADKSHMQWVVMNMLDMTFPSASFTAVIDKCTMDALTTTEGSPWQPNQPTRTAVHTLLASISTLLTPTGRYIQLSFTQPHFRHRYLKRRQYGWSVRTGVVGEGVVRVFVYECVKGGREEEWEDDVWSDEEEGEEGAEGDERKELSSDEEDVLNAIEVSGGDDDDDDEVESKGRTTKSEPTDQRASVR